MRIISGKARGRKLAEFSGEDIRPTPDRVREALFSLLISRLGNLSGMNILELFAGSGAMSLEALSRHAQSAILVDSGRSAVKVMEENIKRCKFEEQTTILKQDARQALASLTEKAPFDLIFMDPPYGKGLIPQVLNKIDDLNLLHEDGIICAESETGFIAESYGNLECFESRRYGSSSIHLFRIKKAAEE